MDRTAPLAHWPSTCIALETNLMQRVQWMDVLGRLSQGQMTVAVTFVNRPKISTRRAVQAVSLPRTSLRRLMHKLNLKPYFPRLLHGLREAVAILRNRA